VIKIIRKVNTKKDFINQIKNKDIKVKNYMDVKNNFQQVKNKRQ